MADSNSSSRAHTSSPSPSASASTQDNKPKKRTRASKPKVRTGCITCKIRRVKCGEEKPACYRCTSTGRTCDGYDNGTPLRNRTPQDSLQEAELKRAEFLRTYQWNESIRSMRPIVADIDGTEMEKKFFHRFRTATEDSFAAHHMCTFTPFWTRLAPRINHQDEAVKHAAIALGAAHQLYQPSSDSPPDNLRPEDIEVFIIQQYNKSISKLQRHVGSSSPESIKVTLVCCLAYICLETLRSSHQAVITHLLNGLKILQSLPPATFDFLADPNSYAPSPRDAPAILASSSFEMADIIRIFGKLECSACFFVPGIHPVVSEHGYKNRRFDDGSREVPFADLRSAQAAIVCFARDVIARVYQVGTVSDQYYFWADMSQQRQQACLRERSRRLETLLINDFLTRPGALPGTGAPDTPEMLCFYINLLHFRGAQLLLNGIDQGIPTSSPNSPSQPYPPSLASPWQHQQQQQFQLPHHPRQAGSSENLFLGQNLDPRLAAQTLVQMQMETPATQYGGGGGVYSSYTTSSEENVLPLTNNSSNSMPTTPGSLYNATTHLTQQHLPFPFLVFNSASRRPITSPGNPATSRLLHEIVHIAEIIYNSPSSRRFRDLIRRGNSAFVRTGGGVVGGSGSGSGSSGGGITPGYHDPALLYKRPYSYAFTSDTGLLGPLSLVALVSAMEFGEEDELRPGSGVGRGKGTGAGHARSDVNNFNLSQGRILRNKALGMLREYVSLGGGPRLRMDDDMGEEDADGEEEVLAGEQDDGLGAGIRGGRSAGVGEGERFWVDYFRMLGFTEALTPGAEHVVMQ